MCPLLLPQVQMHMFGENYAYLLSAGSTLTIPVHTSLFLNYLPEKNAELSSVLLLSINLQPGTLK